MSSFDRVQHDALMARVARRVHDKRMLRLIRRYLEAGVMDGGLVHGKRRTTGMKKGMKESYIEDLASHGGPDHALATREGAAKRWNRGARGPDMQPRNGS